MLFLDFDDVVVLNASYGGYEVALALTHNPMLYREPADDLWRLLMSPRAVRYLHRIHTEFNPEYVLSTSWSSVMEDAALIETLRRSGLHFVADHLHADMTTYQGRRRQCRWDEIACWLSTHPDYMQKWVVLDDALSGTGLLFDEADERRPFVILCAKDVGLTEREYEMLREAFQQRAGQDSE